MKRFSALVLMFSSLGLLNAAETIAVDAHMTHVTVYPERAEVTRSATVTLAAGRNALLIGGLPVAIDGDTVRCHPEDQRVSVVHVHTERYRPQRDLRQEIADLDTAHEQLQSDIRSHEDALIALRRRGELVAGFRERTLERIRDDLDTAQPPVGEWRNALGFLADQAAQGQATIRGHEVAMFELKRAVSDNRSQVQLLNADEDRPEARRVECWIDAPAAGDYLIRLRYQVDKAATWGMHYDLRLDREKNQVELAAMVAVSQTSDEDWLNAQLTFSTRRPSRGLSGPTLPGMRLRAVEQVDTPGANDAPIVMTAHVPPANDDPVQQAAEHHASTNRVSRPSAVGGARQQQVKPGELEIRAIEHLTDEIVYHGVAPVDVEADGRAVLVHLGTWTTDATWHRDCLPEVLPAVFFNAEFANPTGTRLLPGPAQGFLDGDSIGHIEFPGVAAKGRAACAFGVDPEIAVFRKIEPVEQIDERIDDQVVQRWRYTTVIELHNRGAAPAPVRIIEAVPVSTLDNVTITLNDETTAGDQDGSTIEWLPTLKSAARQTFQLSYSISIEDEEL